MNLNQILGFIKPALAAAVPIVLFLVEYGVPKDKAALIALGALIVMICVWGAFSHRDAAALKQVEQMPEVAQILTAPTNADTVVYKATKDIERPKIIPLTPAQGPKT